MPPITIGGNDIEAYKWSEIIKNFDQKKGEKVMIEKIHEIIGYNIPDGCVFSHTYDGLSLVSFVKNIRIENVTFNIIKHRSDIYKKTTPEEFTAFQKQIDAGRVICETEEKKIRDALEAEQKKYYELLKKTLTEVVRENVGVFKPIIKESVKEIFQENSELLANAAGNAVEKNPELLTDAVMSRVEDLVDGRVVELLKFISEMHRDNQQKKV